jgi:serine/threonine protein kinase
LRKYRLEKQPKHVSESCVVVFGTETIKENDGRMVENPVVLKFMSTREMFCNEVYQRREVEKRSKDDSKYIVPIKASFSSMSIDEFDCKKVNLATELVPYPNIRLKGSDLKYVIVMDCGGGYDLHDFISHQNIAGKDLLVVASIAKEIALCLKFLNENCGVCHGDVKARTFVARGVGLVGFAAIDMDNSSLIGRETVGKKRTSTGYLPPEQAAIVAFERSNDDRYSVDVIEEPVDSIMVQISAASSRHDSDEVKRLVQLRSKSSLLRDTQSKPRDVIASSQYDMWCFGALLYFLCTGKQLFNVDMKEDVDDDDLMTLRDWDVTSKYEKLSKVDTKWPVSLLDSLLQKYPNDRPENWSIIVNELNRLGNTQDNYDRLSVFQSAPLVFKDKNNNIQPLPRVNFDQESHMLCEALKDAETVGCTIDVCFETASLDRINAFLAQGISQVMHFSGHGHPSYIALEDERGGLEMVNSDVLKRMVSAVDGRLLVVFISACHSQWVGEAFVAAGVPHAVCCVVDERLQDAAASEFTRNFYRALACRNSLSKAFNMAQQAVQNSPLIMNSEIEADKFLLLPKKPDDPSYHNVPVFFSSETLSVTDESRNEVTTIGLPRHKDFLIGREVQQYSILNDLSTTDVVRVYGKAGVGKSAIVSAVCDHIIQRPRSYPFNCIFWFPSRGSVNGTCNLYQSISSFIASVVNESSDSIVEDLELQKLLHSIAKMVTDKSVLLVLDLRSYEIEDKNQNNIENYRHAVNELLKLPTVKYLKIILISEQISMGWSPNGGEKAVPVWELDLESAIILFAHNVPTDLRRRHPILNSPDELISYICNPSEQTQNDNDYERCEEELWDRFFGGGMPRACRDIARVLSEERAMELLDWWGKLEKDESKIPMDDLFL